jgi:cycloartenol synthase
MLSMRNKGSGGWATYELSRTHPIIEMINPAVLYGDIMIDYPHVECTSACVTALCAFRSQYPDHRTAEIAEAIRGGIDFLLRVQKPEGGWYGAWAICYCYGTWFGVWAQIAANGSEAKHCESVQRACSFLVDQQQKDGGWGESYLSCVKHRYVQAHRS